MHGRTSAKPEDRVYLRVAPAAVHVFDGQSGQRLG
jgi:hypothetical protein